MAERFHEDMNNSIDRNSNVTEAFQKQKEKLYLMTLETHLFSRNLRKFKESCNTLDRNFAALLLDAVNEISTFLNDATIQDNDEKADIFEIIPHIENDICQAHRNFYCKACNQAVRASPKAFNDHFFGNKHVKKLREFESTMQVKHDKQIMKAAVRGEVGVEVKIPRERRVSSSVANTKMEDKLSAALSDFILHTDLDGFTCTLIQDGNRFMQSPAIPKTCELIARRVTRRFPEVKVYPFGSMVVGLGQKGCDLDILVDTGNCYNAKPSKSKMTNIIHQIKRSLTSNNNEWGEFETVTHARTPILRIYCKMFNIDCDLSFSNGLSHRNTDLIRYFVNIQPVCKKLTAFVKCWMQSLKLGVNSYIVSLMVIFYLQQEKLLPSVQHLQSLCDPLLIDDWQANFAFLPPGQANIATDFYQYLTGFFTFYAFGFDYETKVVSVLTGECVDKAIFDHGKEANLPPEFRRFASYMAKLDLDEADEVEDLFANYKPLVIQDPFELCHNVAKGIQAGKLKKIIDYMRHTVELLSQRQGYLTN